MVDLSHIALLVMLIVVGMNILIVVVKSILVVIDIKWIKWLKLIGIQEIQLIEGKVLLVISILLLMLTGYLVSDFIILNTNAFSNITQPTFYKLSGVWTNHEGSLLLWLTILVVNLGYVIYKREWFGQEWKNYMKVWGLNLMLLGIYVECYNNVHLKTPVFMVQLLKGTELNPVLQDPILVIHPPLLYLGYLSYISLLGFALEFIYKNTQKTRILYYLRLFNTLSWSALTIGILLGSWWIYAELGWGGFWFWDPVENVSLLPWLASTTLTHFLILNSKFQLALKTTLIIVFGTFTLSMIGTYLIRSGLLLSVHSFAEDPSIYLGFYLLLIIFTTLLHIKKLIPAFPNLVFPNIIFPNLVFQNIIFPKPKTTAQLIPASPNPVTPNKLIRLISAFPNLPFFRYYPNKFPTKISLLIAGNYSLLFALLVITLALFAPILLGFFSIELSLGPNFYNTLLAPLVLVIVILMFVTPITPWIFRQLSISSHPLISYFLPYLTFYFTLLGILVLYHYSIFAALVLPLLLLALHSLVILYRATGFSQLIAAHLAIFLFFIALVLLINTQTHSLYIAKPGDSFTLHHLTLTFRNLHFYSLSNYLVLLFDFISSTSNTISNLIPNLANLIPNSAILTQAFFPEQRYYYSNQLFTFKPLILSNLFLDLYLLIGDGNLHTGWFIKVILNPMNPWIWISFTLLGLSHIVTSKSIPWYHSKTIKWYS